MDNYINTNELNFISGKVPGFSGKNLIEMPSGGLKLVQVEPHAVYPSHIHPEKTEYVYVLYGSPSITIGEDRHIGKERKYDRRHLHTFSRFNKIIIS